MQTYAVPPLAVLALMLSVQNSAADTSEPSKVFRIGPGVTPPKVTHKTPPKYSSEGLRARIQGTVIFELVVSEAGKAVNIQVLSPLGFGLDEKGREAIEEWRFEPGRKDGRPIAVLATVEVNFRLTDRYFDSKSEERRTRFNLALNSLKQQTGREQRDAAIKTIRELAEVKYPSAMYLFGKLLETGDGNSLPSDPERSKLLIREAAAKDYGPAMFDVGLAYFEGNRETKDPDKGLHMMRDAAILGSNQAQFYLGKSYEEGIGVPQDLDRARRYFGLCASSGQAGCQFRMAKLLLNLPQRLEREYVQAIAWLQLAADQSQPEAKNLLAQEEPRLKPEQIAWALRLKPQLVHKISR